MKQSRRKVTKMDRKPTFTLEDIQNYNAMLPEALSMEQRVTRAMTEIKKLRKYLATSKSENSKRDACREKYQAAKNRLDVLEKEQMSQKCLLNWLADIRQTFEDINYYAVVDGEVYGPYKDADRAFMVAQKQSTPHECRRIKRNPNHE